MNVEELPKIELHHHLDGGFDLGMLYLEAQRRALPQGRLSFAEFQQKAQVGPQCRSLSEFLDTFFFFYNIASDLSFLKKSSEKLVENFAKQNIIYGETRLAPHLFINDNDDNNIKAEAVVENVLHGLQAGQQKFPQTRVQLILCHIRHGSKDHLQEVIQLAKKYRSAGVCGIDLAGDESRFDGKEFAPLFQQAHAEEIPITIHAGEAAGPDSVRLAIEQFFARRIGHGIRSIDDEKLMEQLVEKQIALEVCLTSNLQTATATSYEQHPFKKFYDKGIRVTVNTDDPSVSNITLAHEWKMAIDVYKLSPQDVHLILQNSAQASFQSSHDKQKIIDIINQYFI